MSAGGSDPHKGPPTNGRILLRPRQHKTDAPMAWFVTAVHTAERQGQELPFGRTSIPGRSGAEAIAPDAFAGPAESRNRQ